MFFSIFAPSALEMAVPLKEVSSSGRAVSGAVDFGNMVADLPTKYHKRATEPLFPSPVAHRNWRYYLFILLFAALPAATALFLTLVQS